MYIARNEGSVLVKFETRPKKIKKSRVSKWARIDLDSDEDTEMREKWVEFILEYPFVSYGTIVEYDSEFGERFGYLTHNDEPVKID